MGSPLELKPRSIRRFLKNFLSDQRVVNWPKLIWMPILHGIILRVRPRKVLPEYRRVWLEGGSPLNVYTKAQTEMLARELPGVVVKNGMCYSKPGISEALSEMDCSEITVITAYPQYAPSTVGAIADQITAHFASQPFVPTLHFINSYPDHPRYAAWYARRIQQYLEEQPADALVLSYHSVPAQTAHHDEGYRVECTRTTEAIRAALKDLGIEVPIEQTYQSKFGPGEWIGPATIDTMGELPGRGIKRVLVATPGFTSDCIETVSEIGHLNRDTFLAAGGEVFRLIPPINDDPEIGKVYAELYRQATGHSFPADTGEGV